MGFIVRGIKYINTKYDVTTTGAVTCIDCLARLIRTQCTCVLCMLYQF